MVTKRKVSADPSQEAWSKVQAIGAEDSKSEWIHHSYTSLLAQNARKGKSEAFGRLVNACKSSSDPKVVGALYEWEHFRLVLEIFGGDKNAG